MADADDLFPGGRASRELRGAFEDGSETPVALSALGASLRRAAAALAQIRDDDGVAALEGLFGLFDALDDVPVLAAEVPRLVSAARPGQRPAEQLDKRLAELTELAEQVRSNRTVLKRLTAAEDELRRRLAEHAELRESIDELHRLERLVETLDELSGQQQVVAERLEVLRSRDTSVEQSLTADCEALVRLSEDQLDALGPRTREALRRAEASGERLASEERKLARVTAELEELHQRVETVRAELGERVPEWERYARADRELAEALSAWERVDGDDTGVGRGGRPTEGGTALEQARLAAADVEQRLAAIDRVLREALEPPDRSGNAGQV
ncbi:hypothetical protein [Streptomyces sp. DH10]|uniref:hypothetical protein n=1 Tax=Streptomyces sp. DH10 TaxID=3040121 RepID=UPI0024410E2F|nr:hypothetical protein [Streptomyces sp. DH10]MDG9710483.1 hypothetical protein [Streptomyces sp. DH10]